MHSHSRILSHFPSLFLFLSPFSLLPQLSCRQTAKGHGDKPGLFHSKIWLWFHLIVRHLRVVMALMGGGCGYGRASGNAGGMREGGECGSPVLFTILDPAYL